MSPSILIVGATGNTGRSVESTLTELIKISKHLANTHLIAQSRSASSSSAKKSSLNPKRLNP
ncbi:hypothetical protein WAI453_003394 [Rhynchosporium graminicola]